VEPTNFGSTIAAITAKTTSTIKSSTRVKPRLQQNFEPLNGKPPRGKNAGMPQNCAGLRFDDGMSCSLSALRQYLKQLDIAERQAKKD
jgi:hypothetical protein